MTNNEIRYVASGDKLTIPVEFSKTPLTNLWVLAHILILMATAFVSVSALYWLDSLVDPHFPGAREVIVYETEAMGFQKCKDTFFSHVPPAKPEA